MKRFSSTTLKTAFVKSIPIFCSYVFVSMAYGMMMASAGFPWYDSLLVSLTVYTGERRVPHHHCAHCTSDEQPPEFLQHYLPEGIQTDGAPQAVHDSHDDR